MSDPNERPELAAEAQRFVERLAESFAPDPPSEARRRAFDAALRERIEAPVRRSWWKPALATAAVGAAIGGLLSTPSVEPPESTDTLVATETQRWSDELVDAVDWEAELFTASEVEDLGTMADDDFLPEDYVAIAGLFLDG